MSWKILLKIMLFLKRDLCYCSKALPYEGKTIAIKWHCKISLDLYTTPLPHSLSVIRSRVRICPSSNVLFPSNETEIDSTSAGSPPVVLQQMLAGHKERVVSTDSTDVHQHSLYSRQSLEDGQYWNPLALSWKLPVILLCHSRQGGFWPFGEQT